MKSIYAVATLLALSSYASAATKVIECSQSNDKGVTQIVSATVDDDSEKAEVQLYAISAECAKSQSCGTDVYKKEVLPTVIRLTSSSIVGPVSYSTVIDIDRTNLNVVTRSSLKAPTGQSENTFSGTYKVKVINTQKLL